MYYSIIILLFSSLVSASVGCDELFQTRELSQATAESAFNCYKTDLTTLSDREQKAHSLNRMSYLKFFIAEYHLDEKEPSLLEAINFAENSILLFGSKYSIPEYLKLSDTERVTLAEGLYNYGLATSRYIDIKGQREAIKRMEDIKRSMNSIIRIKEEGTAFYGAHRTLGIFHMKVPYVAGGRIGLSKQYLQTVLENTRYQGDLSLYPANNIAYADLMYKLENNQEACRHLKLVTDLTPEDVRAMNNGLYLETLQSIKDGERLSSLRKCLE